MVANETLGYYLARVHQFMVKVGVNPRKLRFRQHLSNEMAHYACDCWDAECLTSYGWVECVGNADRSCYDLTQHTKATGVRLVAEKRLAKPTKKNVTEAVGNKGAIGKAFKKNARTIMDHLESLSEEDCAKLEAELQGQGKVTITTSGGETFELTKDMVEVKRYEKTVHVEEVVPSVIEPSFGIGRIMYSVLEHSFKQREGDEQRSFLALPPLVAPIKCSVLPLSGHPDFTAFVAKISESLREYDVSHKVDDSSGSIGKRYARTDEIGIPFGVTIDFDTLKEPHSVTLRERTSMKQLRVPLADVPRIVRDVCNLKITWEDASRQYPEFTQQEASAKDGKGDGAA